MTRRARRILAIVLFAHAAGLGATSLAFAHLDYRERERQYALSHVRPDALLVDPDRTHLAVAVATGILAAVAGAAALGIAAFELRIFADAAAEDDGGSSHTK